MEDQVGVAGGQTQARVVKVAAEVEYDNARQVRQQLALALASGADAVIADLTSTTFCDTAGVQEMLHAHRAAMARGIELRVVVPERLMLQFAWTGLQRVLAVYPSLSAALAAAGQAAGG